MAVTIIDEQSEEELWIEFKKTRSPELRDAFIRKYMPLVKYVAGKVATGMPGNVEFDDLVGFGQFGLLDAINKYDPSKNVKFKTYAVTRIRGSMIDELRVLDWVPRSVEDMWQHRHFKSVMEFNKLYRNRLLLLLIESGCSSDRATALLLDHVDLIMESSLPLFRVFQRSRRLDHAGFASLCLSILSREGIEPKHSKDGLIAWQEELLERQRKELEQQLGRKVVYRHEVE